MDFRLFSRNMSKNISRSLSSKHSQKLLDHVKRSATDALKTASKRAIRKTAEANCALIENKITHKITRLSKTSQENNSEIKEK